MPGTYRVGLSRNAKADIRAIRTYMIDHATREVADTFLRRLLQSIEKLENFPDRGSIPEEVRVLGIPEIRQISNRPYRIIYQVAKQSVNILMVVDGRRDLEPLLRRRLLNR